MNTPESDAVKFIYDILDAEMAAGGALHALDVKKLILDEPGTPHENYIAVLFGGGEEIGDCGLSRITVWVDLRSQELMMGATTNPLSRFKKRIELCRQLIRSRSRGQRNFQVENMSYPMMQSEPNEYKKYFFNTTIVVPVIVGGGI
jgi:hypothetical protein